MVLVRDVPDIGVIACDTDLSGAGQVEMSEPADIAGQWLVWIVRRRS